MSSQGQLAGVDPQTCVWHLPLSRSEGPRPAPGGHHAPHLGLSWERPPGWASASLPTPRQVGLNEAISLLEIPVLSLPPPAPYIHSNLEVPPIPFPC